MVRMVQQEPFARQAWMAIGACKYGESQRLMIVSEER